METTALGIAIKYFLVANPIGNSPTIVSLVRKFDFSRQKKIVFREAMFSLLIALFFQYFGELFLKFLHISSYTLTLTGGLVLFTISIQMIFHKPISGEVAQLNQEPFIVPIATPLISGPGLMTIIMITSREQMNNIKITLAILIAWAGVTAVLVGAPYVQRLIGNSGMNALERVMGLILGLISMEMLVSGSRQFVQTLL